MWDVNSPDNGITLCSLHHNNESDGVYESGVLPALYVIHPDVFKAFETLRASKRDPTSPTLTKKQVLEDMHRDRAQLAYQGKPYWSTNWDWMFYRIVKENNKHFETSFPWRKKPDYVHPDYIKKTTRGETIDLF